MLFNSDDKKTLFCVMESVYEIQKIVRDLHSKMNSMNDSFSTFHHKINTLIDGEEVKSSKKTTSKK